MASSWEEAIRNNPLNDQIDEQWTKVIDTLAEGDTLEDAVLKINGLSSVMMISFDVDSNNISFVSHIQLIGSATMKNQQVLALSGLGSSAAPMILPPAQIGWTTRKVRFPTPASLIIGDPDEKNSSSDVLPKQVFLPPTLGYVLLDCDDPTNPALLLKDIIDFTKDFITDLNGQNEVDDIISALSPLLSFLWIAANGDDKSRSEIHSRITSAFSKVANAWAHDLHTSNIKCFSKHSDSKPNASSDSNMIHIDKVRELIDQNNKIRLVEASKEDESDDDSTANEKKRLSKAFKKLDSSIQSFILNASSDGISPPSSPSEKFLRCILASSGAKVANLFRSWTIGRDLQLQRGIATNIGQGNLLSDSEYTPSTFAPHLFPPESSNFIRSISTDENNRIEASMKHGSLSVEDSFKVTHSKIFVPTNFSEFATTVENFTLTLEILLSDSSIDRNAILVSGLQKLLEHINTRSKAIFVKEISQNEYASACILDHIHLQVQQYFKSCLTNDHDDIDFSLATFDSLVKDITNRRLPYTQPAWHKALFDKQKNKRRNDEISRTPRRNNNPSNENLVFNQDTEMKNLLQDKREYGSLFNATNLNGTPQVMCNSDEVCYKFHFKGICTNNCTRSATHSSLPNPVKMELRSLVETLRKKASKKKSRTTNKDHGKAKKEKQNAATNDSSDGE